MKERIKSILEEIFIPLYLFIGAIIFCIFEEEVFNE